MVNPHSGHIRKITPQLSLLNRILDFLVIVLSLSFICKFHPIDLQFEHYYFYLAFIAPSIYLAGSEIFLIYHSVRLQSYWEIALNIIKLWILVIFCLITIAFLTKSSEIFSRIIITSWFLLTPICLIAIRFLIIFLIRIFRMSGSNTRSYIIFGDPEDCKILQEKITQIPWTGLTFFKNTECESDLIATVKELNIDYVFFTNAEINPVVTQELIKKLSDTTASIYIVPRIFLLNPFMDNWITLGSIPIITINDHPFYGEYWILKKMEDLILGLTIFLLTLPLMFFISILIKLSSKGPVLFKQRRYGLNGEIIQVFKFRTMTTMDDGPHVVQATRNDPRITPLGRILRKTSLDELPQFWNVLQGNMSIVGPRPHVIAHNEEYRKLITGYMLRHKVKPGITGWAQVNGLRGETQSLDKMKLRIDYDLYYINHWSLWFDLKIIALTLTNGITGKSAF